MSGPLEELAVLKRGNRAILLLYGAYSNGVRRDRAVYRDRLTGERGDLVGIGYLKNFAAYDQDGRGAAFNALCGAGGMVGAGGFGRILRTHGIRDDAGKGFRKSGGPCKRNGEDSESDELFHVQPPDRPDSTIIAQPGLLYTLRL